MKQRIMSLQTQSSTPLPPIDQVVPTRVETATFGLGWFWTPDAQFGSLNGVLRTRVGYAGGTTQNPTYRQIGDHTETFQVDFDPTIISFTELLGLFWQSHNPKRKAWSRQYRAVILVHDEEQYEQAQQSLQAVMAAANAPITTEILYLNKFYLAETYHQKYRLQQSHLMAEVKTIYANAQDWIDSTTAARLNGYLSGYGLAETFASDMKQLGLSEAGERILQKSVPGKGTSLTCPLPTWVCVHYLW